MDEAAVIERVGEVSAVSGAPESERAAIESAITASAVTHQCPAEPDRQSLSCRPSRASDKPVGSG